MMNHSLFPDSKLEMSSKSLGLDSIPSEKKINFRLFHVEKMNQKKESIQKYHVDKEKSLLQHFQNKGILSSIAKPQKRQKRLTKIKSSLDQTSSYLTIHELDEQARTKSRKRRQRLLTLSNKRFSTSCTNEESPEPKESPLRPHLLEQLKQTKTLESGGVGIRVVRRKRKITINQFLEEKNKKVREYECSKLSRTDIIPNFLIYSKKHSQNQETRLIKNISERLHPTYKLCPNFEALQL